MKKTYLTLLASTTLFFSTVVGIQTAIAQRIVNVNPGLDSQDVVADTSISGVFEATNGVGIDVNSVKIFLNGNDVTNRSTINNTFFSYRPDKPLSSGSQTVKLEYKNTNGQSRVVTWSFIVQQPQVSIEITSVTHNAANETLGPGATFLATINGTPKAKASVLLIEDGKTIREIPAQEVSSGVYVATLNLKASDRVKEGIIIGRLQRQNQTVFGSASQAFAFSSNASSPTNPPVQEPDSKPDNNTPVNRPLKPTFTSHQNGERIKTKGFTIVGQTQPNAIVEIKVSYQVPILGGLININLGGGTLVNQKVTADNNGNFKLDVPAPASVSSGTRYTIQSVATNQKKTSQPVDLTLIQE